MSDAQSHTDLAKLKIPVALRPDVAEITSLTNQFCEQELDAEYRETVPAADRPASAQAQHLVRGRLEVMEVKHAVAHAPNQPFPANSSSSAWHLVPRSRRARGAPAAGSSGSDRRHRAHASRGSERRAYVGPAVGHAPGPCFSLAFPHAAHEWPGSPDVAFVLGRRIKPKCLLRVRQRSLSNMDQRPLAFHRSIV
jgi:hypothetical protein